MAGPSSDVNIARIAKTSKDIYECCLISDLQDVFLPKHTISMIALRVLNGQLELGAAIYISSTDS